VGLTLFTLLHGAFNLDSLGSQIFAAVMQFTVFMGKVLFFCWVFIWVRWTLPRFRYDQLMHLGWKVMLPLALMHVAITAGILLLNS
jgi:NADH-quinone oxidoreductase subunit H